MNSYDAITRGILTATQQAFYRETGAKVWSASQETSQKYLQRHNYVCSSSSLSCHESVAFALNSSIFPDSPSAS